MKNRYGIEHFYIELDVFNDERCIMGSAVCGIAGRRTLIRVPAKKGIYGYQSATLKKD